MNIIVRTYAGNCIVRPDTTRKKDDEDFFPPDFAESLLYAPVLFAHICKPGMSVALRFSSRYYDAINYGLLLYPGNLMDAGPEGFAAASCIDHTSVLPAPKFDRGSLGSPTNIFRLFRDGEEIFNAAANGTGTLEQAIEAATRQTYIRTGDMIAVEMAEKHPLWQMSDGPLNISGTFCGQEILDFNIR